MARKKIKASKATLFSERMSNLRKRAGLTMTALSEQIGVTPSYVSLLESGERQPSRDVVDRLAEVFFEASEINACDEFRMLAGLSPTQTDKIIAPYDLRSSYEQGLQKTPDDFKLFTALVRLLLKTHQDDQAKHKIHEGLRRFDQSDQLQTLLALLELSHKHFQGAETVQKAALEQYQSKESDPAQLLADLHTNLGLIYYLWGESVPQPDPQALEYFQLARKQYQAALKIVPEDVYLLDEYARLCFQLARLSGEAQGSQLWELGMEAFRKVIAHENNQILGRQALREACISMAEASAHLGRFDEAELILMLTRSLSPEFWPTHYALACIYSLQYEGKRQNVYLDRALTGLRQAFEAQPKDQHLRNRAQSDPNLSLLRQKRRKAFDALIKDFSEAVAS